MRKIAMITSGIAGASILAVSGMGIASAATNANVGTSSIPKTVFKTERLDASATVLNTSTTAVQTAHKDKTFKTLVSKAGLTRKTYDEKLKTQLTSDLVAKGYSQDDVTIALQHRALARMHHKAKTTTSSSKS